MNIKYLTILKDNPSQYSDGSMENNPLGYDPINNPNPTERQILNAIGQLEVSYNGGAAFPLVLKELLFIGGKYNWNLGGYFPEAHDRIVYLLQEQGSIINRPFFVLEDWESGFHFIYLDQGEEDPNVYFSDFEVENGALYITKQGKTVSELINHIAVCKLKRRDDGDQ